MASIVRRGYVYGLFVLSFTIAASCGRCCNKPPPAPLPDWETGACEEWYVANNGLGDERPGFYHDSEGSELFPYRWFLLMENKYTGKRFVKDLERFGLVWERDAKTGDLPIGLTRKIPRDLQVPFKVEMLGINCTACHVGQMRFDKKCLRVDGAPNMFDVRKFYVEMLDSAVDTLKSPSKLWKLLMGIPAKDDVNAQSDAAKLKASEDAGLETLRKALAEEGHPELQKLETAIDNKSTELAEALNTLEGHMNDLDKVRDEGPDGKELGEEIDKLIAGELERFDADHAKDPTLVHKVLLGQATLVTPSADVESPLVSVQGLEGLKTRATGIRTQGILTIPELVLGWFSRLRGRVRLFAARVKFLQGVAANNVSGSTDALGGRTDAFGFARNFLFGQKYGFTANTAPIAYPHLWGFSNVEWLHWNGNTTSVLQRNMGQALGVGAVVASDGSSTLQFESLHDLETFAMKLEAPVWPSFFPPINQDLADKGKKIYADRCLACHGDIEAAPPPPGQIAGVKEFALDDIRTDPNQANNFDAPLADGVEFYAELEKALDAILNKYIADNDIPEATARSWEPRGTQNTFRANAFYNARPLRGIWASPPYLHNGSVPTMEALLLPEAERPARFAVGVREYDPVRMGYAWPELTVDECATEPTCYDTSVTGNTNVGHSNLPGGAFDYGTELTADERKQLIEYIKQFPQKTGTAATETRLDAGEANAPEGANNAPEGSGE
jgi:hypothetical protein